MAGIGRCEGTMPTRVLLEAANGKTPAAEATRVSRNNATAWTLTSLLPGIPVTHLRGASLPLEFSFASLIHNRYGLDTDFGCLNEQD